MDLRPPGALDQSLGAVVSTPLALPAEYGLEQPRGT